MLIDDLSVKRERRCYLVRERGDIGPMQKEQQIQRFRGAREHVGLRNRKEVSVAGLAEAHEGEAKDEAWRGPQSQNTSNVMEVLACYLWVI